MVTKRSVLALLALSSVMWMGGAAALAGSPDKDVTAAYAAWDAAFNKADAKAIAAMYTKDALLLPPNHEVMKGPEGVEKFFSGIFGMGATGHKLELIEAHAGGKLIYAAAKWSANGKDSAGKDQPWSGLATQVFERQSDGHLKLKLQTFN